MISQNIETHNALLTREAIQITRCGFMRMSWRDSDAKAFRAIVSPWFKRCEELSDDEKSVATLELPPDLNQGVLDALYTFRQDVIRDADAILSDGWYDTVPDLRSKLKSQDQKVTAAIGALTSIVENKPIVAVAV